MIQQEQVQFMAITPTVDGVTETQFIAFFHDRAVGRVGIAGATKRCASVRQLWVNPEFRCEGIGTQLMQLCLGHAEKCRCGSVNLMVDSKTKGLFPFTTALALGRPLNTKTAALPWCIFPPVRKGGEGDG